MFEFISKKIADIKILHEGYTADYFLNRMKPNALFPIHFIQNNFFRKKNQVPTFFIRLLHMCILEKFYRVIFLFSRFGWSIFVTQLVAKHMKEIII
jgi:choline kinase